MVADRDDLVTDRVTSSSAYRGGLLESTWVELKLEPSFDLTETSMLDGPAVLRSSDPAHPGKVVEFGVARLLHTADRERVVQVSSAEGWVRSDVAAIVLDGIASVRRGSRWVRGVEALPDLFPALVEGPAETGVLQRMSHRALTTGARYAGRRPLADFLYSYGRLPVGGSELAELPDRAAVSRWLGIEPTPAWLRPWRQEDPRAAGWWNLWHLRDAPQGIAHDQPVAKLYVSPCPRDLPEVLRELCVTAAELDIPTLKVGSDAHAVYRPDKLVAYGTDLAHLDALATKLLPRVNGALAHGVPFTAERSADGLLSWGMDPAPTETSAVRTSWRQHCTAVAADGLSRAAGFDAGTATRMATAWLWVNDIDPWTWTGVAA